MADNSRVKPVGYIVRSLGDETFEFKDDTGAVVVEIDDDEWGALELTPNERVELAGEVDRERQEVELDVDSIRLAQ